MLLLFLGAILSVPLLGAATDLSSYRGFHFGTDLATVTKQTGMSQADVKLIHERPVVIQEIEWSFRPSTFAEPPRVFSAGSPVTGKLPTPAFSSVARPDPVKEGLFQFVNGKLYRIVITYDRSKVEGLTTEDMIGAISGTYGEATKPGTEIVFHSLYADVAKVLARWQDADYAYDLIRTGDQSSFALVLYSKQQDALAKVARLEATRLDALDAPRKAREEERKRADGERSVLEKSRAENKPNFRP